ncbi:MAG: HU family DNA-binding protein [Bacteroidota bacterium]|nr:HU family DNA-binding protein [Bacteroidota bacterium]
MNKSDLIETLHQNGGLDRQTAEFVVTEVFQAMTETLIRGKRIETQGLWVLAVSY